MTPMTWSATWAGSGADGVGDSVASPVASEEVTGASSVVPESRPEPDASSATCPSVLANRSVALIFAVASPVTRSWQTSTAGSATSRRRQRRADPFTCLCLGRRRRRRGHDSRATVAASAITVTMANPATKPGETTLMPEREDTEPSKKSEAREQDA